MPDEANVATDEQVDELEQFEKEYNESFDQESFDDSDGIRRDLDGETEVVESEEEEQPAKETAPETKEEAPKKKSTMVTLPDDADAFGELAGKRVSYEQLNEEGLLEKIVTWGHQGRHMVTKGQEELDEARKMRELLEQNFNEMREARERSSAPQLSPAEEADKLVEQYLPYMSKLAEAGGIEPTFIDNYPKVAAQLENRFQAAANVGNILIQVIDEIKKNFDPIVESTANESSSNLLRSKAAEVANQNEMFSFLGESEEYNEFIKWATSEDSTLHWVDKDVSKVTDQDIVSSALFYMHKHPEKFKKRSKPKEDDRKLASGGTGQSKPAARAPSNEMEAFMKDLDESFGGQTF